MARLKFEIRPHVDWNGKPDGYTSRFTDGNGVSTESWWSSPPASIDHVGPEYLPSRHPNVRTSRHDAFIKGRFKELMKPIKDGEQNE